MNKELIMRGQTASGETEILNFSGNKPGYAYRLTEFVLYPSTNITNISNACVGSITAGKTAIDPLNVNYNDEGLIASSLYTDNSNASGGAATDFVNQTSVVNDLFLITQDLILMVFNANIAGDPVNWQCRFVAEKMNTSEEAVTNYKQFTISNDD